MQRRVEQRLREITVRHKTVVFNKFDSLVSEMGLLAAPAHQPFEDTSGAGVDNPGGAQSISDMEKRSAVSA